MATVNELTDWLIQNIGHPSFMEKLRERNNLVIKEIAQKPRRTYYRQNTSGIEPVRFCDPRLAFGFRR